MACDSGGLMGEVMGRQPPALQSEAAAVLSAAEQPRRQGLVAAPFRERAPRRRQGLLDAPLRGRAPRRRRHPLAAAPGLAAARTAARQASAQLGAAAVRGDAQARAAQPPELALVVSSSKEVNTVLHFSSSVGSSMNALDQEMSTRLLQLPGKANDPVECARIILHVRGGHKMTTTPIDWTVTADFNLAIGKSLLAPHKTPLSTRVPIKWPLDNSVEDLLSCLHNSKAVRLLLEENSTSIGEEASIDAMEISPILLPLGVEKISALGVARVESISTKRSIYNSVVDADLSTEDALSRDSNNMVSSVLFEAAKTLQRRDADVNKVDAIKNNIALDKFLRVSSITQEPRTVWLLLNNNSIIFQENTHGILPAHGSATNHSYSRPQKHDSMRKFFIGCNPSSMNSESLNQFITAELGHLKTSVVCHYQKQSRGFAFPELERKEGLIVAKDHMLWERVDVKDVVARASLHAEEMRTTTLSSLKGDFPVAYVMELGHGVDGYYKLRDSIKSLPCICRPKCGPLPDPFSCCLLPACQKFPPRSSFALGEIVDSPQDDECSRNVPIFIRHCSGEVVVTVNLDISSEHMMHLYEDRTKMKLVYHYFKYGNNIIEPDCSLLSYGVGRDATVHACTQLLGGKAHMLDKYFDDNEMLTEHSRPDNKKSVVMHRKACRILSSWLKCFTRTFAKGKSWAGQFTLKHFKVVNEHVKVVIRATRNLNRDNLKADLAELVRWIKLKFSKDAKFPPYLQNLVTCLESLNGPTLRSHEQLFIETHLCCMESPERGMLLVLLRKKYKSLSEKEKRTWNDIVDEASLPEHDYPKFLSKIKVFEDIIGKVKGTDKPYVTRNSSIFRLIRDEFAHGPEHRFDKSMGTPWTEKFKNDEGIELMIPEYVDDFAADVVLQLVQSTQFDIKRELLACQVRCSCHYCREHSDDKEAATDPNAADGQDATGSGPSQTQASGSGPSHTDTEQATGSGHSQQADSASINKEQPRSYAATLMKGVRTSAASSGPSPSASRNLPSSQDNSAKPPQPQPEDDGFQLVKTKKGNRRR